MRVINTSVNTLSTRYLVIGFEGENERTQIRIDAASVFDEYPQASPSMAVKPGFGEEVYPVIVTKEGNEVVWDVTQDNLDFTGDGEIQLTFIKDNVICKTTIGKIRVNRSLIVNGDPPEHLDTWYEGATAKLADVDAAVYSLEALDATASGLPAGASPTVEVQDVNDHKRLAFGIPKGDRGDRGATGNGIRSISQSGSTGLYKKYTIHYTDGTTTTFQVRDGDRGLKGDTGATPDISIGTVETLPAGSEATASMSGTAENPRLNLGIPKGDQGIQGEKGDKGDRGATPVFSMGSVTNLPAGPTATAPITGTAEEPVLNLGIPKGDKGDKGDRGERGPQGIQGIQGDRGLTGPRGEQGQKGDKGDTGATGATGATPDLSIGTVSTLPAGSSATAEITGTAENPVLSLGIPQGAQGIQGEKGEKGDPGDGTPTGGLKGQVLAKASDADRVTEWIHVAPVIKNAASGAIASFPDGADGHPVDELKVSIEPVQDLHGYDHPWPAGGGANVFDALTWITLGANTSNYSVSSDETITVLQNDAGGISNRLFSLTAGDTYSALTTGNIATIKVYDSASGTIATGGSLTFTVPADGKIAVKFTAASYPSSGKCIIVKGSTVPSAWTPYSNICPITGWTAAQIVVSPTTDATDGQTYSITFPTEAGTVYGGTLNVTTGVLTMEWHAQAVTGDEPWAKYDGAYRFAVQNSNGFPHKAYGQANIKCTAFNVFGYNSNRYVWISSAQSSIFETADDLKVWLAEQNTSGTPIMIAYKLATPLTYTLTASEIRTLLGENNIWADTGDVSVKYNADTKLYIDNKITQAIAAALNS